MYLALYRKYRPRRFYDVFGQECVTSILRHESATDSVSHAYLFCGLRGTGKTTCAKILAKAVNCLAPENGEPCGKCENCIAADKGTLLDVAEIDAASNTGVDNIRGVIEEVAFLPAMGKRKVYIIDEVHMLSTGAFNALLKTLEEPPEHVIFILCTTETHKIPATILSRCQRFDFGRIESADIITRLIEIAEKENISLTQQAAALIARLSDGAMRDALSLFELCAGHGEVVDYDTACQYLGVPDRERLHNMCECIVSGHTDRGLEIISDMLLATKAATVVTELIEFFRDLLIVSTASAPEKLVCELPDEIEKCKALAAAFTRSQLLYCMEVLERCLATLPQPNVNARTTLEMAVIRLCNLEKTVDVGALFARVEALERAVSGIPMPIAKAFEPGEEKAESEPQKAAPETAKPTPKKPETEKKPAVEEKKSPEESKPAEQKSSEGERQAFEYWGEFLDAIALEDRMIRSFVSMGRGYICGDTLEIVCEDSMSATMLSKPARLAALNRAAKATVGRPVNVEIKMKTIQSAGSDLLD